MKKARMYQDSLVLLVFMLAILSLTTPAWSASYFVYDQWGGTWHDANKTYVGDSLMCWAASASNVLDWGNWGTTSYNTESTIFQKINVPLDQQPRLSELGLGMVAQWFATTI